MAERKKMNLEESMARLEEIVERLENEKLTLEQSIKLYEEGIKLSSRCASELDVAKRKIKILQRGADGEINVVDVSDDGVFGGGE